MDTEQYLETYGELKRIADALEAIAASLQARDEEAQRIINQLRAEAEQVLTEVEEEELRRHIETKAQKRARQDHELSEALRLNGWAQDEIDGLIHSSSDLFKANLYRLMKENE